jgi:PAS domain S-box-containing protein
MAKHFSISVVGLRLGEFATITTDITEKRKTEEILSKSEEQLRFAMEATDDGIWDWDVKKDVLYWNPRAFKMLGYDENEFILTVKKWEELVHPDDLPVAWEALSRILEKKETNFQMELRYLAKNGKWIWVIGRGKPVEFDENGNVTRMVGTYFDITDRKNAEEHLKISEEKFRKTFLISPDSININRFSDGIYISINNGFTKIMGYTEDEIIGKSSLEFNVWNNPEDRMKLVKELLTNGYCQNLEAEFRAKDGSIKSGLMSASVFELEGEKCIISLTRDISERKIAEEIIKQTRANFEQFFNTIDDFLFVLDEQGNIIYTNETVHTRLGYTSDELFGKSVLLVHPEERREEAGRIVGEMLLGKAEFCPIPLITKQGAKIAVETRVTKGFWNGKPAIFCVTKDISQITLSEEKFSKVFYLNPSACGLSDISNGKYVEVNEAFYKLFGFEKDEVIGKSAYELGILSIADKDKILSQVDSNGKLYNVEAILRAKNGDAKNVLLSAENVHVQDNEYRFTVVQDITEQEHINRELRNSQERFSRLSELSYEGILIHNNGIALDVNASFSKLLGYEKEELIGKNVIELLVDKNYWQIIKESMQKNVALPYEILAIRKDGSTFFAEVESKSFTEDETQMRVAAVRDITLRKKNEQEIRKLSDVVKQSPTSIVITDKDGNIEYVNDHFTKLTGYTFEEALGKNPRILKSGDKLDHDYEKLWHTILIGKTWTGEFKNKKKSGELYWEEAMISPIRDSLGNIINFLAIKTDITEKKRIEAELTEYRENLEKIVASRTIELDDLNRELLSQLEKEKELELQLAEALSKEKEINELKSKFIATVSHEFRTPLAALFSSTQMLERYSKKWSEEQIQKQYARIESTVKYITQLLDDVLTISLADSEFLKNNPKPINIENFVSSIFEELQIETKSNHNLIFTNKLKEKVISIDNKLFKHIIFNLLNNAVKYSPNGGNVELKFSAEDRNIRIEVSDSGVGIPEDELKYIFDAFYRTKNSIGINGSGLGLNITKRAVEVLNGKIYVSSIVNEGTTFIIRIPIWEKVVE